MLSIIFNKSINLGIFPNNLKIGKVCPIYKGKGSKSDPDNYIKLESLQCRLHSPQVHGLQDQVRIQCARQNTSSALNADVVFSHDFD